MIKITQGDELSLSLTCPDHDLTGATMTTALENADGTYLELLDAAHTPDVDQVANPGLFTLDLTAEQTTDLKIGRSSIVTKVEQAGIIRQFHGHDILTVLPTPFEEEE